MIDEAVEFLVQGIIEGISKSFKQMSKDAKEAFFDHVQKEKPELIPVFEAMSNGEIRTLEDLEYHAQIAALDMFLSDEE